MYSLSTTMDGFYQTKLDTCVSPWTWNFSTTEFGRMSFLKKIFFYDILSQTGYLTMTPVPFSLMCTLSKLERETTPCLCLAYQRFELTAVIRSVPWPTIASSGGPWRTIQQKSSFNLFCRLTSWALLSRGRNVHSLTSKSGLAAAAICGTFYDRLLRCISDRVISPMKIFCPSALYILTTFVLLPVGAE